MSKSIQQSKRNLPSTHINPRPVVISGTARVVEPHEQNDNSVIVGMIVGLYIGGLGIAIILLIILWPALETYINQPH